MHYATYNNARNSFLKVSSRNIKTKQYLTIVNFVWKEKASLMNPQCVHSKAYEIYTRLLTNNFHCREVTVLFCIIRVCVQ